jgi:hypothetical protein
MAFIYAETAFWLLEIIIDKVYCFWRNGERKREKKGEGERERERERE